MIDPVAALALATALFVGTHLAMSHPLRAALVSRWGERGFAGVYSLISFVTLGAMIWAWRSIDDSVPLYAAPGGWWWVASALMWIASIFLIGSLRGNPAFPKPGGAPAPIGAPTGVFAITRHPMNWSFILWALVHLSLWGSPRNLIVAAGILLLALAGSVGQDAKKRRLLGAVWRDWEARTAFVPFAGQMSGRIPWSATAPGWFALLGGTILWAAVTWYHAPQVSPIALVG